MKKFRIILLCLVFVVCTVERGISVTTSSFNHPNSKISSEGKIMFKEKKDKELAKKYFDKGLWYYNQELYNEAAEYFDKAYNLEINNPKYNYYSLMLLIKNITMQGLFIQYSSMTAYPPKKYYEISKTIIKQEILIPYQDNLYIDLIEEIINRISLLITSKDLTDDMRYNCLLNRARLYIYQLKLNDAKIDINKCLTLKSDDDELYYINALYYYLSNNSNFAIKNLNKAILLNPEGIYYKMLAEIYFSEGKLEKCFDNLDKAILIEGNFSSANLQKSIYLLELNSIDKAFNILKNYYGTSYDDHSSIYYIMQSIYYNNDKNPNLSEILNTAEILYNKDMFPIFSIKLKLYSKFLNNSPYKAGLDNYEKLNLFETINKMEMLLGSNEIEQANELCKDEYNIINKKRNDFWKLLNNLN